MKTAYDILALKRDAAPIDIEHNYHHLLNAHAACHADARLTQEDLRRLRELRQAYLLLSSPCQRLQYDRTLLAREQRRSRRSHALHTVLAVLSLLGGLLLIGAGIHASGRGGSDQAAARPHALAQAAPAPHDEAGPARHVHN
ncbi:hypothetical protein [Noviherbaspirillum autotrophicum]|uniref:J domain-containing protein n=1 Tax=Noviherbaspirillum autotrophicum TaxID=709839 RepID=A0A0C1YJ93_9BURK|nr:hypothetical protein [Noviherbaspirillum autotrophicum]KIF80562.1 hypothetical protein TSA66_06630 [Noviherbaspirillum autotrophicum]